MLHNCTIQNGKTVFDVEIQRQHEQFPSFCDFIFEFTKSNSGNSKQMEKIHNLETTRKHKNEQIEKNI